MWFNVNVLGSIWDSHSVTFDVWGVVQSQTSKKISCDKIWATPHLSLQDLRLFSTYCVCAHRVRLFEAQWTIAHQAPLSMKFSRQEYWSVLPCLLCIAGGFFTHWATWKTPPWHVFMKTFRHPRHLYAQLLSHVQIFADPWTATH